MTASSPITVYRRLSVANPPILADVTYVFVTGKGYLDDIICSMQCVKERLISRLNARDVGELFVAGTLAAVVVFQNHKQLTVST